MAPGRASGRRGGVRTASASLRLRRCTGHKQMRVRERSRVHDGRLLGQGIEDVDPRDAEGHLDRTRFR